MAPFGALLAGLLAGRFSAPTAVGIGGAACIAGAIVFGLNLPELRVSARQLQVAQEITAGDTTIAAKEATAAAPEAS
jgi:hypothetical protein